MIKFYYSPIFGLTHWIITSPVVYRSRKRKRNNKYEKATNKI